MSDFALVAEDPGEARKPRSYRRGPSEKHRRIGEGLPEAPGEWFRLAEYDSGEKASTAAVELRRRIPMHYPDGTFTFTSGAHKDGGFCIWGRWDDVDPNGSGQPVDTIGAPVKTVDPFEDEDEDADETDPED